MIEKQKKFEGLNCADEGGFFPNQQSSIDNNQSSDQQSPINNNQSRGQSSILNPKEQRHVIHGEGILSV
jgi:hypothetical protein